MSSLAVYKYMVRMGSYFSALTLLGGRKGIRPVKTDGLLAWLSVWSKMQLHMAQLMPLPLTLLLQ